MSTDSLSSILQRLVGQTPTTKDLANADPSELAKSITSSSTKFAGADSQDISTANTTTEVQTRDDSRTASYQEAMNSIVGQDPKSEKSVTTFVSSTDKHALINPDVDNIWDTNSSKYTEKEITKVNKLAGADATTSEEADSSLKTWIVDKWESGKQTASELKSDIGESLSPLKDTYDEFSDGIDEVMDSEAVAQSKELYETLPPNMRYAIQGVASNKTGRLAGTIGSIQSKSDSFGSFGEDSLSLLGMGDYPEFADEYGNPIPGQSGSDVTYDKVNRMYRDARNICSNIDALGDMFSGGKDFFDMLFNEAINSGLARLIKQLMECGDFTRYSDRRTSYVGYRGYNTSARRGDPYTYGILNDQYGRRTTGDIEDDLFTLGTNLPDDDDSHERFKVLTTDTNVDRGDLFRDSNNGIQAISTDRVVTGSSKQSRFVDDVFDKDTQLLAKAFSFAYK